MKINIIIITYVKISKDAFKNKNIHILNGYIKDHDYNNYNN
jgi:hypothetical protein